MLDQAGIVSSDEPTGRIRWRRAGYSLVLEQQFTVLEYRDGTPYREHQEWRDVEVMP